MAREFNIPPVVFPSGGNPGGSGLYSTARFQPPQPARNPNLPFMTFDISSTPASTSFSVPAFVAPPTHGGFSGSLDFNDELPLLEELGISTHQIRRKTLSILNPFRTNPCIHEDADLFGPFIFLMAFGLFQLLAGKLHFGILLGWIFIAALFLYVVFNMLAGRSGNLDLYRCLSLVGYCMLPMVVFSAAALFVPRNGLPIFIMAAFFVLWSTRVCTNLLVELASYGDEHRILIAYPCLLVYILFSLLILF